MHIDIELQIEKVFAIEAKHPQVMKQQEPRKQRVVQWSKLIRSLSKYTPQSSGMRKRKANR